MRLKSIFLAIHPNHTNCVIIVILLGLPGGSDGKESASNVGDLGYSIRQSSKAFQFLFSLLLFNLPAHLFGLFV